MTRPWEAERAVTEVWAARLIDSELPELAPARVEPLGMGWDNTAFLVNGDLVFRFPRRTIAAPLLEHEIAVLPAIAPRLPLPIPEPRWVGGPTADYPWRFAGYRRLAGVPATAANLDERERRAVARPLGAFLAALHAAPPAGALPDEIRRTDRDYRRAKAEAALDELGFDRRAEALAVIDAAPDARPASALVHGDLYSSHLLVDGARRLCGVIDWGDLHHGDPAVDLAGAIGYLPPTAFEDFLQTYGSVDEATLRMARFRAVYHAANLARYARHEGDAALLRESLAALAHVLEIREE